MLGFTVIKVISAGSVGCSIHLVDTVTDWTTVLPMLTKDLSMLPVIMLDCEWVSQDGKSGPVALLQLATYTVETIWRGCNLVGSWDVV